MFRDYPSCSYTSLKFQVRDENIKTNVLMNFDSPMIVSVHFLTINFI
jgi:hypothetical protein